MISWIVVINFTIGVIWTIVMLLNFMNARIKKSNLGALLVVLNMSLAIFYFGMAYSYYIQGK